MDFKPKNREWVKNAAIIFLAVLLVLTFFSNTWMNHSLPEVATQNVSDGAITAKVRGTGKVTANGSHQVKAEQTREIRAVMVKAGQEVNAGDVLFVLGEGSSEEVEAAQDALLQLQASYQRTAIGASTGDYSSAEAKIKKAKEKLKKLKEEEAAAKKRAEAATPGSSLEEAQHRLDNAILVRDEYSKAYNALKDQATAELEAAEAELAAAIQHLEELLEDNAQQPVTPPEPVDPENPEGGENPAITPEPAQSSHSEEEIEEARQAVARAEAKRDEKLAALAAISSEDLDNAQADVDKRQAEVSAILATSGALYTEYEQAKTAREAAEDNLEALEDALTERKAADAKSQALTYVDLSQLGEQIERAKQKLNELSGGEDNQILAKVSGTVQTVDCTSGDTKAKGDVLCTIEVPDMGYNLSFSVTNEQAQRLRPGDTATVSNYYWGQQIQATLSSIQVDPKNPQTNKLLTFDLEGDVNAGADLTLSVGSKSANYDVIVPNSAIRSDSNGSFVLAIEAKNSPLGNRYIARRVNVEVLASDDVNSAVTAELGWGDYVITTSNAPVKSGDMVRLADS